MANAIVVGAGVIGLATAWELSRRGWSVTICDPAPASQATRAAAGMLAPAAEVVWGQDALYPLMRDSAERYPEFVARIEARTGRPTGYLRNETLVVGLDSADRQTLDELAAQQTRFGMRAERINALQARRLEPALGRGVVGGVHLREDHQIDPRTLTSTLLEHLGERVRRARVVSLLEEGGTTVGVVLADGSRLRAEQIVLATGLAALPETAHLPLRPVYGDVARLRLADPARPLVDRTVRALVRGRPCYVVPRADGSLVLGATSREDARSGVSAEGIHQLLEDGRRVVPGILEADLEETMARARPGTPDDLPVVGRLDAGAVVSTGYFRHGILLAPLAAAVAADLVEGRGIDHDIQQAVDPGRFAGAPAATHHRSPRGSHA
ncbi:glycine oxidase ThiO [Gulosibacter sp. 10]|uniref:glycine oxidase ThiO n=1 Tax=Gulosibacter sp. 10 TaxID=1255570 RepID=UPI00097E77BF|nr:glycine oxidase ThiO [Gulosibacter sp. 10]SJM57509.1 Glycine oxidase ThiO [Gulosibacter sp. 10]